MRGLMRRMVQRLAPARRAPQIAVSESRGLRQLHIGGEAIQSAMRIDDPYALALDYTRCMMAFLLFHPAPRRALLVGLGGGSLAKYLHRHFRAARITAIECNPQVVAMARTHFALPLDDARLTVEIGDGAQALAPECCDLLMVDGFDDEAQVPGLVSQDFYDAAWLALETPGALVVNFMSDDPQLDRYLRRIERAFDGAVLALPAPSDPNVIVIALRGAEPRVAWRTLAERARRLETRHALPFARYLRALRHMNPHDAETLVVRPEPAAAR